MANNRSFRFTAMLLLAMIILLSGCSQNKKSEADEIAIISANVDSPYAKTFNELSLGSVVEYNLKLLRADRSWVEVWIEGYKKGKKLDKPLLMLSYGRYPHEVEESKVGVIWIRGSDKQELMKLYSGSVRTGLTEIEQLSNDTELLGRTGWETALGDKPLSLKPGETMLIGSARMNQNSLRTGYDWFDPKAIEEMIQENDTVLLLKIKVKEVEGSKK